MTKLRDIMTQDVEVIRPDASIVEAAEMMRNYDVGAIPVCDGDRILGMLTDRDITVRGVAAHRDPEDVTVAEIMTRDVEYCFDSDSVASAARHMRSKQIRRLIVIDRDKNLKGIVSLGDLAVEHGDRRLAGRTLQAVSENEFEHRSGRWGAVLGGSVILGTALYFANRQGLFDRFASEGSGKELAA